MKKTLIEVLRVIGNTIALLFGIDGKYRKEAEEEGICYYEGQE